MPKLTESPAWRALLVHHDSTQHQHMRELFAQDARRFSGFSCRYDEITLDYSKNRITSETMSLLFDLAKQAELSSWIGKMFSGEKINSTEGRSVLHTALRNRSNSPVLVDGVDVMPEVNSVLAHMKEFTQLVRSGTWTVQQSVSPSPTHRPLQTSITISWRCLHLSSSLGS